MFAHRRSTAAQSSGDSVVILVDAATRTEQEVIGQWLNSARAARDIGTAAPITQLDLQPAAIAERLLNRTDNPLVVPVRVLWLPRQRHGAHRVTFGDVARLHNPRNPNRLAQRRLVRSAPERYRVLVGQPARLDELRAGHPDAVRQHTAGNSRALARAIVHAGTLALERAQRSIIGDRYKVPRLVTEHILDSPDFQRQLRHIAERTRTPFANVLQEAERDLRNLVAAQSRLVTDLFTQAMRPIHASTWNVEADESGLEHLRELGREHALIFLPSHRSYADALVLGDVLARGDFPPNHVVGGANLRFWPIGPIARRTGTIFIRRSFGDDPIYKAVVEEYFGYLLSRRFNVEWYFEGGRTRTGKLRTPRYGLLNFVANTVRSGRVRDVYLVPVSITYERLNELGALSREQLGGHKRPEGLAWLARYARAQQHSAGKVYVRFGTPLSLRERLAAHDDPLTTPALHLPPDHTEPLARDNDSENNQQLKRERRAVQKLAFDIASGIDAVTPITVNGLVTLALLGVDGRAVTSTEVCRLLAPVLDYIRLRRLPCGALPALRDEPGVAVVLEQLALARIVTVFRGGVQPVYSIEAGAHLEAAFYRNSAVHWFVPRAILELSIVATDMSAIGWSEAYRLRELLKYEFFLPGRKAFAASLRAELDSVDSNWQDHPPESRGRRVMQALTGSGFLMAHRVLRAFLEAQWVVASRVAATDPTVPIVESALIAECLAVGRQLLLQKQLHSVEAVSTELFTGALHLIAERELLAPAADVTPDAVEKLRRQRQEFAAELHVVTTHVARTAALDPSNRPAWEQP